MSSASAPTLPMLTVGSLTVSYGKISAIRNLSLAVNAGEIVGLVGPNSAGKTSTALAIASRTNRCRVQGTVTLEGVEIHSDTTPTRWLKGVRLVPQGRQIFPRLTVEENLRVMAEHISVEWRGALHQAQALFPKVFVDRLKSLAGNLSGGEQQMLALARALLGTPKLLILDEPSLGLSVAVTRELARVLANLREKRLAILIADQTLGPWKGIVDRTHVLVRGELVGTAHDVDEVSKLIGHH